MELRYTNILPSNVLWPTISHVSPERVGIFSVGVKMPEAVDKAFIKKSCEPISLLIGETWCLVAIRLGIFQIFKYRKVQEIEIMIIILKQKNVTFIFFLMILTKYVDNG